MKARVDDVALYHQVLVNEIGWKLVIGQDAPDLGGGQRRSLLAVPFASSPRLVLWRVRSASLRVAVMISQPSLGQPAHQRRAHHATYGQRPRHVCLLACKIGFCAGEEDALVMTFLAAFFFNDDLEIMFHH